MLMPLPTTQSRQCDKDKHVRNIAGCRTLPSNLALCVNPDFDYVRAQDPVSGRVYIVAEVRHKHTQAASI